MCTLLGTDSPFAHFDGQKLREVHKKLLSTTSKPPVLEHQVRSLKVVVQRALIQLPPSLHIKSKEMERGEGGGASSCDEQLLICSTCGVCVHKCKFMCDVCMLMDHLKCVLLSQPVMVCWMCLLEGSGCAVHVNRMLMLQVSLPCVKQHFNLLPPPPPPPPQGVLSLCVKRRGPQANIVW